MSFSSIEFGTKNFKAVSSYSGDSITGQYDIDFATNELTLNFDKPFDSVKGAPWAKNISDTKRKRFIVENMSFYLHKVTKLELVFVDLNPIKNSDMLFEIIFNKYTKH
jgi:hypothetical protein